MVGGEGRWIFENWGRQGFDEGKEASGRVPSGLITLVNPNEQTTKANDNVELALAA